MFLAVSGGSDAAWTDASGLVRFGSQADDSTALEKVSWVVERSESLWRSSFKLQL